VRQVGFTLLKNRTLTLVHLRRVEGRLGKYERNSHPGSLVFVPFGPEEGRSHIRWLSAESLEERETNPVTRLRFKVTFRHLDTRMRLRTSIVVDVNFRTMHTQFACHSPAGIELFAANSLRSSAGGHSQCEYLESRMHLHPRPNEPRLRQRL